MALLTHFAPWWSSNTTTSPWDLLDDHPFFNLNSSFFREANIGRANRANVQETDNEYKIELEVPGYQKEEIHIEFSSDAKSVTISGKHESSYKEGPAEGVVEEGKEKSEGKESEKKGSKEGIEKKESKSLTETRKETTVGKPTPKYWISERSVGEFSRTFSFATPLDVDKAVAKLESGLLTLTIPKATTVTPKKITIS
jgi:HSP20 family molecular chaperone IbpA